MRPKLLDVALGIVVIILVVVLYNRFRTRNQVTPIADDEVPEESVEENLEDVLGIQIPDEGEKLELSNGDSRAVARIIDEEDGTKTLSIIADLPELAANERYEVTGLGIMSEGKGGYILNKSNVTEVGEIEIKKGNDVVLEGSF